jgi:hypothetical protein
MKKRAKDFFDLDTVNMHIQYKLALNQKRFQTISPQNSRKS